MECISSVRYYVFVNGQPSSYFEPSRGIWQGDQLSAYLFILCTEGLSVILKKAVDYKLLKGVSVARQSPVISHLFFC